MKLKKGDKVRVIKPCGDNCSYCYLFKDKVGIISRFTQDGRIEVDRFIGTTKYCSGFKEECLELVERIVKQYGIVSFCKENYV